jgi:hypothetical protein
MDAYPNEFVNTHEPVVGIVGQSSIKQPADLSSVDSSTTKRAKHEAEAYITSQSVFNYLTSLNNKPDPFLKFAFYQQLSLPPKSKSQYSPNNTNSPLYPDGLICTEYVAKVTSLPSCVVSMQMLWEPTDTQGSSVLK